MQTIRTKLTNLKTLAASNLPEGKDIFGYQGIDKDLIATFIDEAYSLSYSLSQIEPHFEITILKRKIGNLVDECKKYLKDEADGWKKEDKFNGFLIALTSIRDQIRFTYLVVIDKGLRTESESNRIIEENEKLDEANKTYKARLAELATIVSEINSSHQSSLDWADATSQHLDRSESNAQTLADIENKAQASFALTSKLEDEIRQKRESAANSVEKIDAAETKSMSLLADLNKGRDTLNDTMKTLGAELAKIEEHSQDIQDTIEGANRAGMAGSFKKRKDELDAPIRMWGAIFLVAIISIFLVGYHLLSPYLGHGATFDRIDIVIKIALVSPFVWLAWMSVKQYGYLSRIQEDYAYKYASAMAFEGYKKQAKEINEELLDKLLVVSIENLSQNPIRLFNTTNNHGSPANELAKDVISSIRERIHGTSATKPET